MSLLLLLRMPLLLRLNRSIFRRLCHDKSGLVARLQAMAAGTITNSTGFASNIAPKAVRGL